MDNRLGSDKSIARHPPSLAFRISFIIIILATLCVLPAYAQNASNASEIVVPFSNVTLKTIVVVAGAPYTFVNDKGQPDGFSVDLMQAVAQVMGFKIESRADIWDNARQALENGEIDFLPLVAYSRERENVFDFTPPYTIAYDAFFTRKDTAAIQSMDDLEGKTIIVLKGDRAHNYLLSLDSVNKEKLIPVDTLQEGLRLLASGKGDTVLMPKLMGLMFIRDLNLINIDQSPLIVEAYKRPFSFAVKKGDNEVLERLNQGLIIVKNNGQYKDIYDKWFGALEPNELTLKSVSKYIVGLLLALLSIGSGFALWSFSLRKQVASRTRKLADEIFERKQTEEALRKNESILNETQNLTKVGGWEYSVENNKITWTDEVYRIYGVSPRDYDPNNITEDIQFYAPEERGIIEGAFKRAVEEGETYDLELKFMNGRGEEMWIRTIGRPELKDERVVRVYGNIMDITQRKQAEEELKKYRENLEELVKARTAELNTKNEELERFNKLFVGRELRMIELKKQIEELKKQIAEPKNKIGSPEKGDLK